jgi:Ni,Fe-hydrogenase III small subunit
MMFDILRIRMRQGWQAIPDVKKAEIKKSFRGLPVIGVDKTDASFMADTTCPVGAITKNPLAVDMGRCIFCGDCVRACKNNEITFTNFNKLSADESGKLKVTNKTTAELYEKQGIKSRAEIKKIFGRSLKLRQVSAGGCSGCELELNACSNVNFDMGRFGIDFTASPRHSDGIVITGPITKNMAYALEDTFEAVPEPKIIILAGTCAISGGLFADSDAINRDFLKNHKVDLYVPGCPIHPLTFINGVLKLIGR